MSRALIMPSLFLSPESPIRLHPPATVSAVRRKKSAIRAFAEAPARTWSLYEVLRLKQNASRAEIKTAYRSLAKLYHPDASSSSSSADCGSDGLDFIDIHNAYATLSDPSSRELYDMSLGVRRRRAPTSSPVGTYSTRRWETDQCW